MGWLQLFPKKGEIKKTSKIIVCIEETLTKKGKFMKKNIFQYFIIFMLSGLVSSQVLAMVPLVNNTGRTIKYIATKDYINLYKGKLFNKDMQQINDKPKEIDNGYEEDVPNNMRASLFLVGKDDVLYDAGNWLIDSRFIGDHNTSKEEPILVITVGQHPEKWQVAVEWRPNLVERCRQSYKGPEPKKQKNKGMYSWQQECKTEESAQKEAAQKEEAQKEAAQKEQAQREQARQREEAIKREQTAQREQAKQREEAIKREQAQKEQAQKEQAQKEQAQSVSGKDPMDEFPGAKGMTNQYQQSLLILGVDKNASESAITKAYYKLALKWHPDKWALNDRKYANSVLTIINIAKEYLLPKEKAKFDETWEKSQ